MLLGLSGSSSNGLSASVVLDHAALVPRVIFDQAEGWLDFDFDFPDSVGIAGSFGFHHGRSSSAIRKWAGCEVLRLNGLRLGIFQPSAWANGIPKSIIPISATSSIQR